MASVTEQSRSRIVLPMDGMTDFDDAVKVINSLHDLVGPFKLGLELMDQDLAHRVADYIAEIGGQFFWDEKWSDIPNTAAGAVKALLQRHPKGIWAVNVHGNSGRKAVQAVVENRGTANVLGVTILTSLDESDTDEIYGCSPAMAVLRLAKICVESGVQGLICSPQEVTNLRRQFGEELLLVTPGVRPAGAEVQDQARVDTPGNAIRSGSDYLVIGRPITKADSMRVAAKDIADEIADALQGRSLRQG